MTIKVGDRLPTASCPSPSGTTTATARSRPNDVMIANLTQRQENRDLRFARRVHADLLGEACSEIRRQSRQAEVERHREVMCVPSTMGS